MSGALEEGGGCAHGLHGAPYPASPRLLWPMTQVFYAAVDVKKNPKENPVSMATQLQLETPRPRGAFPGLGLALEPGGAWLDRRVAVVPLPPPLPVGVGRPGVYVAPGPNPLNLRQNGEAGPLPGRAQLRPRRGVPHGARLAPLWGPRWRAWAFPSNLDPPGVGSEWGADGGMALGVECAWGSLPLFL